MTTNSPKNIVPDPTLPALFFKTNVHIGGRMREPFDESRDFTLVRSGRVAGKPFEAGAKLDKSLLSIRTLRQMYENRQLRMLSADPELLAKEAADTAARATRRAQVKAQLGAPLQNLVAPTPDTDLTKPIALPEEVKVEPMKPMFEDLSVEELRRWLGIHNVIPRPRTPQNKLIEACEAKWTELLADIPGASV